MQNVRFVYLMRLKDNKVVFIVDAEDSHSKDYSLLGQVYTSPSLELKAIFTTGKPLIEGPLQDQWGNLVSAHAPIFDPSTGKVIAISALLMLGSIFCTMRSSINKMLREKSIKLRASMH